MSLIRTLLLGMFDVGGRPKAGASGSACGSRAGIDGVVVGCKLNDRS
jgi:hypothetical protein